MFSSTHHAVRSFPGSVRTTDRYRRYPETAVDDVARIRRLLAAGSPIRVIDEVLDYARDGTDHVTPCLEPTLRTELTALDSELDDLAHRRNELLDLIEHLGAR